MDKDIIEHIQKCHDCQISQTTAVIISIATMHGSKPKKTLQLFWTFKRFQF